MLDFAVKLNNDPGAFTEADVKELRMAGFDDTGILDVVMMVCLFNFMNRLADGLGTIVNPNFEKSKERADHRVHESLQADSVRAEHN